MDVIAGDEGTYRKDDGTRSLLDYYLVDKRLRNFIHTYASTDTAGRHRMVSIRLLVGTVVEPFNRLARSG